MNRKGQINSSFDWSCSYKFSCANAWRQCNKPFWRKFSCTQRGATAGVTLNWHFKIAQKVAKYLGYFSKKVGWQDHSKSGHAGTKQESLLTRPIKIWSHWNQTRSSYRILSHIEKKSNQGPDLIKWLKCNRLKSGRNIKPIFWCKVRAKA